MKYTREQCNRFAELVLDTKLMNYSIEETILYIEQKTKIKLSYNTIGHIRYKQKDKAKKEFNKLREDKFEYNYQFMKRIHELENLQKEQWNKYKKADKDNDIAQQNCLKELHSLTNSLTNLYQLIPQIEQRVSFNDPPKIPQPVPTPTATGEDVY